MMFIRKIYVVNMDGLSYISLKKKKNPQFLVNKVSLSSKFDFRTLIESDSLIQN